MHIRNIEIARIFEQVANLLELQGENQFRIRAYRNAARSIESLAKPLYELVKADEDLSKLESIGKDLANKILEIIKTGKLKMLQQLQKSIPKGLVQLTRLQGLGSKKINFLYKELNITSLNSLEKAARSGAIEKLKRFGKKTQENIIKEIEESKKRANQSDMPDRMYLADAREVAFELKTYMQSISEVKKAEIVGSFRRCKETVGDLDILIIGKNSKKIMDHFTSNERVHEVLGKGSTKSSVVLNNGLQVDLRVVGQKNYGAALLYFTGSKAHSVKLRQMAIEKGLKINEYGVYRDKKWIAGKTEEEVYKQLNLPWIAPELREDNGEIEAAQKGALPPHLIELNDLRGDLHCHTTASDGKNSLQQMAHKAQSLGHSYLAITEHSKRAVIANGLDVKRLEQHIIKIDKLNDQLKNFQLLKGIEVDILKDGKLDLPGSVLKKLDVRVCSIHYDRNLSLEEMTDRIVRAMDNPYFNILGHPTGRIIGKRVEMNFHMQKVLMAAKERGCAVEVNCQPERMDLNGEYCKMAKEIGVKLAISTDSHNVSQLDNLYLGIAMARRGWIEKSDVINTMSWVALRKFLNR